MKNYALIIPALLLFLLSGASLAQFEPEYVPVHDGISYANIRVEDVPWSIHILRIERSDSFELHTPLAEGRIYGLSQLGTIARQAAAYTGLEAVAAINGDWFQFMPDDYQGNPRGLTVVDGELIRGPCIHYPAFMVSDDGTFEIMRTTPKFRAIWPDGTQTLFTLNDRRSDSAAVLYTPVLGLNRRDRRPYDLSTRTRGGHEIILKKLNDEEFIPSLGDVVNAEVVAVKEQGNSPITYDTIIFSIGPELVPNVPEAQAGNVLQFVFESDPFITGIRASIGGGTVMVRDGEMTVRQPRRNDSRHPRSLIGWNDDYFFFVVVDGRLPGISAGMDYYEMSKLMAGIGCLQALEMDGGGSSTLWLLERGILNTPSDGWPRNVANAIILMRKPAEQAE